MTPERLIVAHILRWTAVHPSLIRLWRNNTGVALSPDGNRVVKYGLVGSADLTGVLSDGRRIDIECKTARGRQRDAQRKFQLMIERFRGLYVLARSVEDVETALVREGYSLQQRRQRDQ